MLKKIYYPFVLISLSLIIFGCSTLRENPKVQNKPLVGTYWSLEKIDKNRIPDYGRTPYIMFSETGNFNGTSGCNRYFGTYILTKKTITLENTGATKKMCANMEIEKIYFSALKKEIKTFTIVGDTLVFYEKGKEVLRFIASDNTENPKE
jgi:heat shock protein HslJ